MCTSSHLLLFDNENAKKLVNSNRYNIYSSCLRPKASYIQTVYLASIKNQYIAKLLRSARLKFSHIQNSKNQTGVGPKMAASWGFVLVCKLYGAIIHISVTVVCDSLYLCIFHTIQFFEQLTITCTFWMK